jgi:cytochrome c553
MLMVLAAVACEPREQTTAPRDAGATSDQGHINPALVTQGQTIFRFDTFGDETFWTDTLRLHEKISAAVSPAVALQVGLKVDVEALPAELQAAIAAGDVDLNDPATTVALLKLGAVLGISGQVDESDQLTSVGTTCALCHSTVDNSFAPGIGRRLDGWPNRDLDVGAIIALSDALTPEQRAVYQSWGPGLYDPRFSIDGLNLPVVLPPAFGLRHVKLETYTGDGEVSYWNAYVAITQMHGHGHFSDPRIGVERHNPPDLVSAKLPALRAYQLSIESPAPAPGTFDPEAARRGKQVFNSVGGCARCHLGGALTDVNAGRLHPPAEAGQDGRYAARSATQLYRTTPLRGLWNPPQLTGPYFHDGSAATLDDVVEHYIELLGLELSSRQRLDLVEYLKTL